MSFILKKNRHKQTNKFLEFNKFFYGWGRGRGRFFLLY